jgi:transcription elongation factor GreA
MAVVNAQPNPSSSPGPAQSQGEAITPEGLESLKSQLFELETVARRELAQRILVARGHGDLKENAEYHAAKDDQAHHSGTFSFGRTADVRDEGTGDVQTWTIVGPTEADRAAGKLSAESPVAKALLDHAPGDVVEVPTPRGTRRLRIERLR